MREVIRKKVFKTKKKKTAFFPGFDNG